MIKTPKKNAQRYANISNIVFVQKSQVHWEAGFPRWHTHTAGNMDNILYFIILLENPPMWIRVVGRGWEGGGGVGGLIFFSKKGGKK